MNSDYRDLQKYIDEYWSKAAFVTGQKNRASKRNQIMHIGAVALPNMAIAPNHGYFAGTQFYWDTYFTVLGLVNSNNAGLARGMIDNLLFLHKKFGLFPARNSTTSKGRTQPPFLTRMAWEVFEHGESDVEWLKQVMLAATDEYETVWMGKGRYVEKLGLSQYHPKYFARFLTTYESGWDRSARFAQNPTAIVPVDLNAQLFQYEDDLMNWCEQYQPESVQMWRDRADKRKALITQYFWDDQTGFFYDYDVRKQQRRPLKTLAGFFPLWSGAATPEQAAAVVKQLPVFEHDFGLACTEQVPWTGKQWDYPNGWAPLMYIAIAGLRRYGYNQEAVELSRKWLNLNQILLQRTGQLWEKYDVVKGEIGLPGRYPTQPGFSWTNAVALRLIHDLKEL